MYIMFYVSELLPTYMIFMEFMERQPNQSMHCGLDYGMRMSSSFTRPRKSGDTKTARRKKSMEEINAAVQVSIWRLTEITTLELTYFFKCREKC